MLFVSPDISIPISEFQFSYSRSPGPGGQNVNKLNTKVTLRWNISDTKSLPDDVRHRLQVKFANRINKQDELIIVSHRFRDQSRNVADCLGKLRELVASVAQKPKPRKRTKPGRRAVARRLDNKRKQSDKKQRRRVPRSDE